MRRALDDEWRNWLAARVLAGESDFGALGVSAADAAASGLARTDLDGGYRSTGVQLVHRRRLGGSLQVIAQAGSEFDS